jgi:lipoprotein-anchoring transpeptidase ErfK/SrfK
MTAGAPASPSRTGTFKVVDKKPSETFDVPAAGNDYYTLSVSFYIKLSPNGPAIYAAPGEQAFIGKENHTHGEIELTTEDAAWLYNKLAVGDTIQIVAG